ncbi:MAG: SDR family NAD(P)-dependent oxidoreductase [Bacteroidota bacterium]|nr:SDR family NAD(P)-dependent oxidoreductase [Bacteroidota bacterium]MDP4215864.1 SDR family NAD(P)-dependent oxidoreductase [Bacteroidota bacterium]MDP4246576.1 SDR family NAD(P)-dependent oxidoreductase [Bacteroidota bacterium]MDP4254010.1 SDR family NAD(P)-dependent oxidoreductase [Bacteroidota bacterium]MDP4258401.1 SDR family NAD(P)-dependent oxidoreductase [Bacteroidota bacterium]
MAKTILITGANGNLGTATVKKFLDSGYTVLAIDQGGSHLGFAGSHPNFTLKSLDLSNEAAVEAFIREAIGKYGRIDGALMLVGGFAMGDLAATDGAALRKMMTLNVETAYFMARPLFAHMMQNGYGRLVFMGARPALKPEQGKSAVAYALSKGMLFELAALLNASAKGKNVVASVVAPSTIDTEINRKSMPDANPADWVKAEQIADVLEFICSEKGEPIREAVYKVYNNA